MPLSDVQIVNRALGKLGARRIDSLADDSANARAAKAAYTMVRDRLLRAHPWNFAIRRASIAADAEATSFGGLNQYRKPEDFLALLRGTEAGSARRERRRHWRVEGEFIVSTEASPLEFRYIARITNPEQFDALFADYFALALAVELCDEISQDRNRKELLITEARLAELAAKRANGLENPEETPPEDDWVLARL